MSIYRQTIRSQGCMVGLVLFCGMTTAALPALAQTNSGLMQRPLIGQINIPTDEGIPSELYRDVEGVIVSLNGDQVQLDLGAGLKKTYMVPEVVQRRYRMAPGGKIILTVRDTDNDVVDVSLPD